MADGCFGDFLLNHYRHVCGKLRYNIYVVLGLMVFLKALEMSKKKVLGLLQMQFQ